MAGSELLKERKYLLLPWDVILAATATAFSPRFGVGDDIFPVILGGDVVYSGFRSRLIG
jgi:hypothetical protein